MAGEGNNLSISDERKLTVRSSINLDAACVLVPGYLAQEPSANLAGSSKRRAVTVSAFLDSPPSRKPCRAVERLGKHDQQTVNGIKRGQWNTEMQANFSDRLPGTTLLFPGVVIRIDCHLTQGTHRLTGIPVRLRHGTGHRIVRANRCIRYRGCPPTIEIAGAPFPRQAIELLR